MPGKRPLETINFKLPPSLCAAASKNSTLRRNAVGNYGELRYSRRYEVPQHKLSLLFNVYVRAYVDAIR